MHTQLLRSILLTLVTAVALSGCGREDGAAQAQDYLGRAQTYADQGQYRAAMIEITNAMNSDPADVQYPRAMAEVYITLGASRRASELLEAYLPEHRAVLALPLAEAYLMQGKFLSARDVLKDYQPRSSAEERQLALYRADIQRVQGNLETSEQAYRDLLEQYPDDLEIQLRLAENHLFSGASEQAAELLHQLRQTHPEHPEVLQYSAIRVLQDNELEQAERYLTDALMVLPDADTMLPERASVLRLLSETLSAQGRTAEALVYQKALADKSPGVVEAQQRLQEATASAEAGDYEQAEAILNELLEENPDSQSASLLLGMVNLSQGELASAEQLLSQSVDVETASPEVIRAAAMAQAQTGKLDQAMTMLQRSLEARPDDAVLLSLYGVLALNTPEREREGYLSLQKALAKDPHRGNVRLVLARHHFQRGETEQGLAQLRAAFDYQPADWPVTRVYVNQLLSEGQLNELATVVERLNEAAPRAPETRLFESQYRFRNGNTRDAIRQLEALLEAEPHYAQGHGVLAQMYLESSRPEAALSAVERVIGLTPSNEQALRAGVQVILSGELEHSPQQWLARMAKAHPEAAPNATALRAMLHRDQGELAEATDVVKGFSGERNAYLDQVASVVYRDRARELASNQAYEPARALLGEALERFPVSRTLNLDLARIELAQARYQAAETLLADLAERYPEDPEVHLLTARRLQATEGESAAYHYLLSRWEAQPSSEFAPVLINLARAQDAERVQSILDEWEQADPDNRGRLLYMAEEYQRRGDDVAAMTAYEQLIENNPDDPVALNNLAWMLKNRDLTRGITLAERAAKLQPNSAAILDTYGWLLHLNGNREAAIEQLERAVELAPGVSDIEKNLEAARLGL